MDRLARFSAARNFALFYGCGRGEEMSRFDVAVVEPAGQNKDSLRIMRESGTLALAYLSVVEVNPGAPEFKLLKDKDFLSRDGRPVINDEYGNYMADLRSSSWTGLLLRKAGSLMAGSGYDGLFLDTIGNVEFCGFEAGLRDSLLFAAADVVRQIRKTFAEFILVQNNGLENLCLLTSGDINGICWENPCFHDQSRMLWASVVTSRLEELKERHGIKVLMLLEETGGASAEGAAAWEANYRLVLEVSKQKGFLLYRAPFRYIGGVNPPEG